MLGFAVAYSCSSDEHGSQERMAYGSNPHSLVLDNHPKTFSALVLDSKCNLKFQIKERELTSAKLANRNIMKKLQIMKQN
jgi:hypothetical protein